MAKSNSYAGRIPCRWSATGSDTGRDARARTWPSNSARQYTPRCRWPAWRAVKRRPFASRAYRTHPQSRAAYDRAHQATAKPQQSLGTQKASIHRAVRRCRGELTRVEEVRGQPPPG
jgi:hypothetical protein